MDHRYSGYLWSLLSLGVSVIAGLIQAPAAAQEPTVAGATMAPIKYIVEKGEFHGGLVVLIEPTDADQMLAFAKSSNILVQGLVADPERLKTIRTEIQAAGLYGRASAILWTDRLLPYADGTVNLVVLANNSQNIAADEMDRVLAPLGTVWTLDPGPRLTIRKSWPDDVDQWSHARYDASGNAVSKDRRVGPPQFMQWEAAPRWNRGVKTSGLVTTRGRLFYVLDDSHFATRPPTWSLIARDAFNGIRLWRRELESWGGSRGGKKVGPAQVNRRLVASDEHVFATLVEYGPVSMLDAATGSIVRTFEHTKRAEEFLLCDGTLVVLINPSTEAARRRGNSQPMQVVAVDPKSGHQRWTHSESLILPLTLVSDGRQVVFHDGESIKSLDLTTGKVRWKSPSTGHKIAYRDQANPDSPGAEKGTIWLAPQFAPTMIIYNDVVAFAGGRQLNVVSAEDGHELWKSEYAPSNYSVPVDLFGFGGSLWGPDIGMNLWRPLDDNIDVNAYDPLTGEVTKSVKGDYGFRFQHHRCHQMKVVGDTVLAGRAGIEFLDTNSGDVVAHHWTRGSCYYGVLPANGRLYIPPHDCACYVRAKLAGFYSFSAQPPQRSSEIPDTRRLLRGVDYEQHVTSVRKSAASVPDPKDWPTHRHDVARSGRASGKIGTELLLGWQHQIGGQLTSPIVAENRLFVACTNAHTLHAIDADTGEPIWQFTCDGRIDSPPTFFEGLVLFGCRDGSVHALRADDGALVWRFIACPRIRSIVSHGQLESAWPVHGSVLVVNGVAYFAAGRTSYVDGGLRLYGLDPHTGQTIFRRTLNSRDADGAEVYDEESVDGYLNDVLSSDGEHLFMRHQVFDLEGKPVQQRVPHLHSPDGYLSPDTTNRLLWTYAPVYTSPHQGAFYDLRLSRMLFPSGRLLVEDDETIFGYGQNRFDRPVAEPGGQWALFAASKQINVPLDLTAREYRKVALSGKQTVKFHWWKKLPVQVRAMAKTDDVLFVAGPHGSPVTSRAALRGDAGAALLAIAPENGEVLAEMSLPSAPTWDGLTVAGGRTANPRELPLEAYRPAPVSRSNARRKTTFRELVEQRNLYVTLANGQVLCLWSADSGRTGTPLSPAAWQAALPPIKVEAEPGLIGRWRFDEGQGMVARDCSGRGHDATVTGSWAEGERGVCLRGDGTPRAAVIPDAPHLRFGNSDFSLALWVQADAFGARILGKEAFPANWWVINLLENGQAELVLGEGRGAGATVRAATGVPLTAHTWSHLVAVVDRQAGEVRWHVNGTPQGRQKIPTTMTKGLHGGDSDISIPSAHKPFRGLIGDLRIYSRSLTPEQVSQLYQEAPRKE